MKMEPIVSSETSAIRTQTPGNYPKRNNLHLEHGESLRTRLYIINYNYLPIKRHMLGPTQTIIRLYSTAEVQIYIIFDSATCPNVNISQITDCTVKIFLFMQIHFSVRKPAP